MTVAGRVEDLRDVGWQVGVTLPVQRENGDSFVDGVDHAAVVDGDTLTGYVWFGGWQQIWQVGRATDGVVAAVAEAVAALSGTVVAGGGLSAEAAAVAALSGSVASVGTLSAEAAAVAALSGTAGETTEGTLAAEAAAVAALSGQVVVSGTLGAEAAAVAALSGTAAPFAPDDISGLSWWLQADAITGLSDTDPVTTWEDLSPSGIDATEATNPPTYHTNVQNGLPAVRFDSDFDILVAGSHPLSGASAGTLFLVLSNSNGSSNAGHPSDDWGSASQQSHYPFSGNIYDTFGTTSRKNTGSVAAGTIEAWHIYEVTSASNYWESWINGTSRFSTASNTVGWHADQPQLGAPHDVVGEWPGDIGEVVAYDSDLSSADRTDVRNYLADRWGITL